MILVLLDWAKAFDRVSHPRMMQALERFNLPIFKIIIASFHSNLSFQVKHEHLQSSVKTQSSGIRQGCPLSPFLFVLIMIVLFFFFHDIGVKHYRDFIDCRLDSGLTMCASMRCFTLTIHFWFPKVRQE